MACRGGRTPDGGERGAVSTLFAIILVTGVFLGALALAVDVGQVVLERRLLQNSADAAALAAAQLCSKDRTTCVDPQSLAGDIAAALGDGLLDGAELTVCGSSLGLVCPEPDVSDIRSCPPDALGAVNYVEVHLESTIATVFGAAAGGDPAASPRACARASWGPIAVPARTTSPIAISECAWRAATGGAPGGSGSPVYQPSPFGQTPGYGRLNPWPGGETILAADAQVGCSLLPDGSLGGGIVLLDTADGCAAEIRRGPGGLRWVEAADPAVPACEDDSALRHGEVVHLPVVSTDWGADRYEVLGMAAFYLAGWSFIEGAEDENTMPSVLTDVLPCVVEPVDDPVPDDPVPDEDAGGEEPSPVDEGGDPAQGEGDQDADEDEEEMGTEDPQPVACLAGWFVHHLEPRVPIDPSGTGDYGIIAIELTG